MLSAPVNRRIKLPLPLCQESSLLLLAAGAPALETGIHKSQHVGVCVCVCVRACAGRMEMGGVSSTVGSPWLQLSVRCAVNKCGLLMLLILRFSWFPCTKSFHGRVLCKTSRTASILHVTKSVELRGESRLFV
jgi:hypothetical protein